jgi:hypothetical protein
MAVGEYACKMRTPNDYKYIKEGQNRRMADKYTVDELRRAYLLELSETLKVGDRIEIQRPRASSVDDTRKCSPDSGFEMVEIVSELDRAPAGNRVFEVRGRDGSLTTFVPYMRWRRIS